MNKRPPPGISSTSSNETTSDKVHYRQVVPRQVKTVADPKGDGQPPGDPLPCLDCGCSSPEAGACGGCRCHSTWATGETSGPKAPRALGDVCVCGIIRRNHLGGRCANGHFFRLAATEGSIVDADPELAQLEAEHNEPIATPAEWAQEEQELYATIDRDRLLELAAQVRAVGESNGVHFTFDCDGRLSIFAEHGPDPWAGVPAEAVSEPDVYGGGGPFQVYSYLGGRVRVWRAVGE